MGSMHADISMYMYTPHTIKSRVKQHIVTNIEQAQHTAAQRTASYSSIDPVSVLVCSSGSTYALLPICRARNRVTVCAAHACTAAARIGIDRMCCTSYCCCCCAAFQVHARARACVYSSLSLSLSLSVPPLPCRRNNSGHKSEHSQEVRQHEHTRAQSTQQAHKSTHTYMRINMENTRDRTWRSMAMWIRSQCVYQCIHVDVVCTWMQ